MSENATPKLSFKEWASLPFEDPRARQPFHIGHIFRTEQEALDFALGQINTKTEKEESHD